MFQLYQGELGTRRKKYLDYQDIESSFNLYFLNEEEN